jgi:hypothetical protein
MGNRLPLVAVAVYEFCRELYAIAGGKTLNEDADGIIRQTLQR